MNQYTFKIDFFISMCLQYMMIIHIMGSCFLFLTPSTPLFSPPTLSLSYLQNSIALLCQFLFTCLFSHLPFPPPLVPFPTWQNISLLPISNFYFALILYLYFGWTDKSNMVIHPLWVGAMCRLTRGKPGTSLLPWVDATHGLWGRKTRS